MKPSTKVFAILSLSAAIGGIMQKAKGPDTIKWRGECLYNSAFKATGDYPFPIIKQSKADQIESKVGEICKEDEEFDVIETLSLLLCGLADIRSYMGARNKLIIDPVMVSAKWAMEIFDPGYKHEQSHINAMESYEKWVS